MRNAGSVFIGRWSAQPLGDYDVFGQEAATGLTSGVSVELLYGAWVVCSGRVAVLHAATIVICLAQRRGPRG